MKYIKPSTFLLIVGATFFCCNKANEEIGTQNTDEVSDPALFAIIESPYLEEALIDLGIDSDEEVNGRTLKTDIVNIIDLELHLKTEDFFEPYNGLSCPEPRYDYDWIKNSIVSGLGGFKKLKKLILTIESCQRQGVHLVKLDGLESLEEFHFNNDYTSTRYLVQIGNCPNLIKIGTAVPRESKGRFGTCFSINEGNFHDENSNHVKFMKTNYTGFDFRSNIIADFELENLPSLASMELINFGLSVSNINTPKLKTIFLLNSYWTFTRTGSPPPFPKSIEAFYYYTQHASDGYLLESGMELNLRDFPDLKKVHYIYDNPGFTDIIDTGMNIKNGNNIANDVKVILEFPNPLVAHPRGVDQFYLCLDEDIAPEFLTNNVKVITTEGIYDGTKIDANCD